jgi:pSer/pThr/pTyr-binding forkhead associated (FHA) protein
MTLDAGRCSIEVSDRALMDPFLKASGLTGPLRFRLCCDGRPTVDERSLDRPFALIGRDRPADICLLDRRVSRRHAYFQAIAGAVACVDLQSRTGVWWGDESRRSGWLGLGQAVGVGPFRIEVLADAGPGADTRRDHTVSGLLDRHDPLAPAPGNVTGPGVMMEVLVRKTVITRWRVDRVLTLVGRAPESTLQLDDLSVSRTHCSLVCTPTGLWAVDLMGKNGLRVNGETVAWASVGDGDELRVGRFELRIRAASRSITAVTVPQTPLPPLPRTRRALAVADPGGRREEFRDVLERSPTETAMPPNLLAPLVARMQQQLAEQFALLLAVQQALSDQLATAVSAMTELTSTQQEHQAQVREELEQIRRLSRELGMSPAGASPRSSMSEAAPSPVDASSEGAGCAERPPAPNGCVNSTEADTSVHLLLQQRIAEIQFQRQDRWRKILGLLTGR